MSERGYLWLAVALYLAASVFTLRRLRRGFSSGPVGWIVIAFLTHTVAMFLRGQHLHRCPVTNVFEVQVFIAWSAVLFYLLIGSSYRVSFLGAFTAPLVALVLVTALLAPIDVAAKMSERHSAWVEFHAAVGILACGALALACVMGTMYLIQERQLKSRRSGRLWLLLPAVEQLDVIGFRLLVVGFALLSIGVIGGVVSQRLAGPWPWPKTAWAVAVWCLYGVLLAGRGLNFWQGRMAAWGAVLGFLVTLVGYWGATWLVR